MVNKCYQKPKERLWKKACERYQNCSEEEKDKMEKKVWDKKMFARKKKRKKLWVYEKILFSPYKVTVSSFLKILGQSGLSEG